jgi:hypothetical protein
MGRFLDVGQLLDQPANKYRTSTKPLPLLGRLQRTKGEIDHGHESLERKLRYLLWLN